MDSDFYVELFDHLLDRVERLDRFRIDDHQAEPFRPSKQNSGLVRVGGDSGNAERYRLHAIFGELRLELLSRFGAHVGTDADIGAWLQFLARIELDIFRTCMGGHLDRFFRREAVKRPSLDAHYKLVRLNLRRRGCGESKTRKDKKG